MYVALRKKQERHGIQSLPTVNTFFPLSDRWPSFSNYFFCFIVRDTAYTCPMKHGTDTRGYVGYP
ncbi:hypothetical protein GMOD_00004845 [Pyrenophora seminiperda CCB06]|uniref:Uncharacterized protein n=1 Tax=Pyrenophora seminiperda CCB06 TaxID=1302712 RepID=A0A3M7MHV4_9PLEO|nr:hypothetical protein GMOD_00004845 [Pyrenophora seminiperda CCB06]